MKRLAQAASALLIGMSSLALAASDSANAPYFKGQIVVSGQSGDYPAGEVIKHLPLSGLTVLSVEPGKELAAVARQRKLGRKAMLNLKVTAFAGVNDPFYRYQWNLDNIQAPQAWDRATGFDVTLAVLDTGLKEGGNDGIGCVVHGPMDDIVNLDSDPADGNGHGTHVSGTIAQASDNGIGVAGVAHGACILPVKVLDDSGSGSMADVAEGIYYAVDNGARVINMSLGVSARYRLTGNAMVDPALDYADQHNVVVVAAAGNDGFKRNVSYPAIYPTTIAVGATGYDNDIAPYSNQGSGLDIVAPGGNAGQDLNGDGYGDGILQETYYQGDWNYYFFQGTSMATPHVAAAAALLISNDSSLTPAEVFDRLAGTSLDLGGSGYDSTYGYGLIQIDAALAGGGAPSNSDPIADFSYACAGLSCSFTSTSSDSDGSIVTYGWDLGDGSSAFTADVLHIYGASGYYDVVLTVTDDRGGFDSRTQRVTVVDSATGCTDADGDGHCSIESGGDDCDDTDAHVYPGHNDSKGRWARDGVDNDCNGLPDA